MQRALCFVVVGALTLLASPARAHEVGKTQMSATFGADGAYQIDVTVDPDALLTKLEVFGGVPLSRPGGRVERDQRIASLGSVFLDQTTVRFDGMSDRPRFEYVPASDLRDSAQAPSHVRLFGTVPRGAQDVVLADGMALGSYALNVRIGDSPVQTFWLEGGQTSEPISLVAPPRPPTRAEIVWQYFGLGFTHVFPMGIDHILFALGIFLLSFKWRTILLQLSAFTVAHAVTFGLAMVGAVSLPARIVDPLIAISIAYLAAENLLTSELKPWRLALVFSFGLLHGMGFAGVLRDLGLPRQQLLTALVGFNAGVEAGQLAVVAGAFAVVAHWRRNRGAYRRLIVQPASIAIALAGVFWTLQRALF